MPSRLPHRSQWNWRHFSRTRDGRPVGRCGLGCPFLEVSGWAQCDSRTVVVRPSVRVLVRCSADLTVSIGVLTVIRSELCEKCEVRSNTFYFFFHHKLDCFPVLICIHTHAKLLTARTNTVGSGVVMCVRRSWHHYRRRRAVVVIFSNDPSRITSGKTISSPTVCYRKYFHSN